MSLVNNSANNFKDFLDAIKPYLNYQMYDLSGQGVEVNNFSTDEKVIGTWIDGKPLYQKTVSCGALPNASSKEVSHNITNLNKIVSANGFCDNGSTFMPLPYIHDQNVGNQVGIICNTTKVILLSRGTNMGDYNGYVTLQYTKTTDSAVASGEKIVGQWIDGKPVYEKVYTFLNHSENGNTNILLGDTDNKEKIIKIDAIAHNSSDGSYRKTPLIKDNSELVLKVIAYPHDGASPNSITIYKQSANTFDVFVTIRYTKTTD